MNFNELFTDPNTNSHGVSSGNANANTAAELINIQGSEDPHARYKMPKILSRIKDKGKFAETFITNLPEISTSLHVPLPSVIKFMESNLGSQFLLADKGDNSSYFIKGRFDYEALYKALREFINTYVLCSKCGLPELEYKHAGKNKFVQVCKGCGKNMAIDPKDRIYKLFCQL